MTTTANPSHKTSTATRPAPAGGGMRKRQQPLMQLYVQEPAAAWIHDGACTVDGSHRRLDPVHGQLRIGTSEPLTAPVSVHSAVGGDHDGPNPGDYLTAAMVGCFDTTLRIIADRLGIVLEELHVTAKAELDVRGTLRVSPDVPVGFQRIRLSVHARPAPGTPAEALPPSCSTRPSYLPPPQTVPWAPSVSVIHSNTVRE